MLKIKDNIDLKKLEEFGFTKKEYGIYEKTIESPLYFTLYYRIYPHDKSILWSFELTLKDHIEESYGRRIEDTLYDLIQAGLVEKVEG